MKPIEFFPDFLKLKDSLEDIEKLVDRYGLDSNKKFDEKPVNMQTQTRRVLYLRNTKSKVEIQNSEF